MTDLPAALLAAIDKAEINAAATARVSGDGLVILLAQHMVGIARAHRRMVELTQTVEYELDGASPAIMYEVRKPLGALREVINLVAGCYGLGAADPQRVLDSGTSG